MAHPYPRVMLAGFGLTEEGGGTPGQDLDDLVEDIIKSLCDLGIQSPALTSLRNYVDGFSAGGRTAGSVLQQVTALRYGLQVAGQLNIPALPVPFQPLEDWYTWMGWGACHTVTMTPGMRNYTIGLRVVVILLDLGLLLYSWTLELCS
ncbi:hypothetical protein K458DRAFT_401933 [Lentithecium fluviatile CBS 122367]|uniref:Uncharacterized protein n=1 Tax=Lentithecium fluviatile CBS 122367 TaxID=1168545 RepID=A0A6G1JAZ4_9PLEO|nr:hypothetical protein K458DRAFT_401933 [Lentithecium fluviatile CBS 122367]